jgi:hypothetical protein
VIQRLRAAAFAGFALILCAHSATAGMGPCIPANFDLICGSGDGAARAIIKTISPSQRLAFAWRLADRPPNQPNDHDPKLENLIVRIEDGATLAKSQGSYWDLGTKIAKEYLMTAWSPDSHLLVKVAQSAEFASVELFAFAEDDAAIGPFDLAKAVKSAITATEHVDDAGNFSLVFAAHPGMTVDDNGLFRAVVNTRMEDVTKDDVTEGTRYDVTVQVIRSGASLAAHVVSVTPHPGTSISIIVH